MVGLYIEEGPCMWWAFHTPLAYQPLRVLNQIWKAHITGPSHIHNNRGKTFKKPAAYKNKP